VSDLINIANSLNFFFLSFFLFFFFFFPQKFCQILPEKDRLPLHHAMLTVARSSPRTTSMGQAELFIAVHQATRFYLKIN